MVTQEWGEFVFAPPPARAGNRIVLASDEAHHLYRVRRVRAGEAVFVTDGEGLVHRCRAEEGTELEILETLPEWGEPPQRVTLCMAVLKGDANREVVDLAVQLGAAEVRFFQGRRSEGRLQAEKLDKLRRVAVTAIKQCGRARLPELSVWSDLAAAWPESSGIFLAQPGVARSGEPPGQLDHPSALVVGPEGGLAPEEIQLALARGARPVTLGRRRLRAETAAAAGLTWLLTRLGECGLQE